MCELVRNSVAQNPKYDNYAYSNMNLIVQITPNMRIFM